VHADEAAGKREGVDRHVAHAEELEILAHPGHRLGQASADRSQVLGHLRVVDELRVAPHVAHDALAQTALDLRGELGVGGPAKVGQSGLRPGRLQREQEGHEKASD
jgi:hypothetical protein